MTPDYVATAFVVCLAPGIGVIYTLSVALGQGRAMGLWAALGCTLVTGIHLAAAMAGLAAILQASAVLFQTIKFAGVAYLLWMAWTTLRGHGALAVTPKTRATSPMQAVGRGIVLNLLNPKLPVFFVAFLPQFLPQGAGLAQLLELGLGFVAITGLVMAGYALAAGTLRGYLVESPVAMTWLRRVFAACFAGLGLRLAAERI